MRDARGLDDQARAHAAGRVAVLPAGHDRHGRAAGVTSLVLNIGLGIDLTKLISGSPGLTSP